MRRERRAGRRGVDLWWDRPLWRWRCPARRCERFGYGRSLPMVADGLRSHLRERHPAFAAWRRTER